MKQTKPTYVDLETRLAEAEAIIQALRAGEADAVVGTDNLFSGRIKDSRAVMQRQKQLEDTLHELHVHQEELETQNEDLRIAQQALSVSHKKYQELFNSAPIGYLTLDRNGLIRDINSAGAQMLGHEQQHLFGKPLILYVLSPFRGVLDAHLRGVFGSVKAHPVEIKLLTPDERTVFAVLQSTLIQDEVNTAPHCLMAVIDITDRKQADDRIKTDLREKEAMLAEIHHRVKNNMQVISSLLKLQSAKIEDKKYVDLFKDSENRIRSMALIHEKLYQTKDFANIDFSDYVKAVSCHIVTSYRVNPGNIKLKREIEDFPLGLDHAIPCGLIINELVSNSMKHAFPKGREGEIKIALRSINDHEVELTVSDDGVGIPREIDMGNPETLGLELVQILAENQLDGTLEFERDGGTEFRIRFGKIQPL
jgi:PAS domain S-box-containing protein